MKEKKHYLKEHKFMYEIILSQGKGKPTDNLAIQLHQIANRYINKLRSRYEEEDLLHDIMMEAYTHTLSNFMNFDTRKHEKGIPYFTEVFKRGIYYNYNLWYGKKNRLRDITFTISIHDLYI